MVLHRRSRNTLPWARLEARFPGIPRSEILRAVEEMEGQPLQPPPKRSPPSGPRTLWSWKEDQILESWWGLLPSPNLCLLLPGRTKASIYAHAYELGYVALRPPRPPTHVTLHSLSKDPRWGYGYRLTKHILEWAKKPLVEFGFSKGRGRLCVSRADARAAEVLWARTESVVWASKRLGVPSITLWEWLEKDRKVKRRARTRSVQLLPEVYNEVYERYRHTLPLPKKRGPKPRVRLALREDDQQKVRENAGQAAA